MSNARDHILSVKGVAKFFGTKLVFKNVDCALGKGQIMLVAGHNGAGKSTLMKIMAGLSRASAGEVELHIPEEKAAYLGHETFIYSGLTAMGNLRFWAQMYGLSPSRDELEKILDRVGLLGVAEEKAGGFSRGMAQRLNLARIYLVDPEIIFLDEPGTGLDVKSLANLRKEITGFRDRGVAVVWISHHVAEDTALADVVLELDNGKARYFGPASGYDPEVCQC